MQLVKALLLLIVGAFVALLGAARMDKPGPLAGLFGMSGMAMMAAGVFQYAKFNRAMQAAEFAQTFGPGDPSMRMSEILGQIAPAGATSLELKLVRQSGQTFQAQMASSHGPMSVPSEVAQAIGPVVAFMTQEEGPDVTAISYQLTKEGNGSWKVTVAVI